MAASLLISSVTQIMAPSEFALTSAARFLRLCRWLLQVYRQSVSPKKQEGASSLPTIADKGQTSDSREQPEAAEALYHFAASSLSDEATTISGMFNNPNW
ncbi:unnamed protein product [Nezara viridula]|uniref:Uncharacterized protein n=1 Tax=Nezara viridula TaxID=85310 RepID=A0A9P0EAW4_NEZVI|nr:unnamed protein product [Nezara viridula]